MGPGPRQVRPIDGATESGAAAMPGARGTFLVNVCLTGMVGRRRHNPHLPVTALEIARDVEACLELGASIFHLHARDEEEEPDWRPQSYERVVRAVREVSPEAVVCVSTSGRRVAGVEQRAACLDIDPPPDMASLTLGSIDFLREGVLNEPATVRALAERMAARGVRPELEIFDLGMARAAARLIAEGVIPAPAYANLLLGNSGSASAEPADLAALLAHLPAGTVRCVAGIGAEQLRANLLGLLFADGVRVGLEDNLWLDARKTPATNPRLVERVVRLAAELELRPATIAETRVALGL